MYKQNTAHDQIMNWTSLDHARELKTILWKVRIMVIPILVEALGTVIKKKGELSFHLVKEDFTQCTYRFLEDINLQKKEKKKKIGYYLTMNQSTFEWIIF